jgi:hypothetical protein
MKIEAGKYYQMRNGQFIGPVERGAFSERPWVSLGLAWSDSGSHDPWHGPHQYDLISEVYVSDTPPADAPSPETKTLRDEFEEKAALAILSGYYANPSLGPSEDTFGDVWDAAKRFVEAREK